MPALGDEWIRQVVRDQFRSRRTMIWGALLSALALALTQVPVFGVVGFGFAFAMALPASVAAADLGAALVRRARRTDAPAPDRAVFPGRLVLSLWLGAAALALALLVPPLAIVGANGLWVTTCQWGFGLAAYVLMPGLSAVLAAGIGVLCGLSSERRRLSPALPYLVIAVAALVSLWRFYASPPAFSFNPFIGYFPGNLYDEELRFPAPFYAARAFYFAAAVAAAAGAAALLHVPSLTLARARRRRPGGVRGRPLVVLSLAAVTSAALWSYAGELGFLIGDDDIAEALGKRYESENFIIYYPGGGSIERDIEAIAADHEFRYAQVTETLGAEPSGKITSYYFRDAEQKHRYIGARHVHMAKPWRREIYLNHRPFPHSVLRHEIAHVVAGAFGDPIFGVSARRVLGVPVFLNPGLIEGIAVAADWPDQFGRALTPHQSVKAMIELDYAPPVEQVFSTRFLALASARGYTLAGSVTKYLLDEYGAERLRALYRSGGDFDAVYGRPRDEVLAGWRAMIGDIELSREELERVRERFRRPGLFDRPCPHAIARKRGRARDLSRRGAGEDAVAVMKQVTHADPGEPRHRLELGRVLVRAGEEAEAAKVYEALADDEAEVSAALRAQALSGRGGIAARRGDFTQAARFFERAARLPGPDSLRRQTRAELGAARGESKAAKAARAYFWGFDPRVDRDSVARAGRASEVALAASDEGLGHYLLGLSLRGRGAPKQTTAAFTRALDRGLSDPLLVRNAARELAPAGYLAKDAAAVERAAGILDRRDQPAVHRLYGRDWRERLEFSR